MTFNRAYNYRLLVGLVLLLGLVWLWGHQTAWQLDDWWRQYLPGWVYPDTVTVASLQDKYQQKKLKILVVPGHDHDYPGAVFNGLREEALNLALANDLVALLRQDDHLQVMTTRDPETGEYTPELANYFTQQRADIVTFREQAKDSFRQLVSQGQVTIPSAQVAHNFAPSEVSVRLYGINKWANEHDIDLTLHIHFNDNPGHQPGRPGDYSGFAIYVPEKQYPNAAASLALAEGIKARLSQTVAVSDLPLENAGTVDDQELVAVGANATRVGASFLIEYSYIYESAWQKPLVRSALSQELAWQTYTGLEKYFTPASIFKNTALLPYQLDGELSEGMKGQRAVLALQKALQQSGFYPPAGKTLNQCPINGNFGPCVKAAVQSFQQSRQIQPTGYVGQQTLKQLRPLLAS